MATDGNGCTTVGFSFVILKKQNENNNNKSLLICMVLFYLDTIDRVAGRDLFIVLFTFLLRQPGERRAEKSRVVESPSTGIPELRQQPAVILTPTVARDEPVVVALNELFASELTHKAADTILGEDEMLGGEGVDFLI